MLWFLPRLVRGFFAGGSALGQFRLIDLRSGVIDAEQIVEARSPEDAAAKALGEKVIRGGQNRNRMVCRVYWEEANGQVSMVRLYRAVEE